MKDILNNIWEVLKNSSAATRLAIFSGFALAIIVGGASMYRSANPHMEFFVSGLDNSSFTRATRALSQAGVRFETSTSAPYTVWVESGSKYDANNAIAAAGALDGGKLGIDTSGTASAWASSIERKQVANARYWQEVEQQLMQLHWVQAAKVLAKMPENRVLGRAPNPSVSVMLTTSGMRPSAEQSLNVGNIVRTAFNVPQENITILDQSGAMIFDGERDDRLDETLAYERDFNEDMTQNVQQLLDDIYGARLTRVSVRGAWSFVKTETVGASLDPEKRLTTRSTMDTSSPSPIVEGGPAGLEESFLGPAANGAAVQREPSTKSESDERYAYGSQTTHRVEDTPILQRLSISLTLDSTLEAQSDAVAEQVKAAVGYSEERGDKIATNATVLSGIERDEEGNPMPIAQVEAPAPPNAMMGLLLERGIELAALLVFFFLLARSFKAAKPKAGAKGGAVGTAANGMPMSTNADGDAEIEIDPSVLARMHIEKLLESDPDRVSSLLTRWAMGEDFYAKSKS